MIKSNKLAVYHEYSFWNILDGSEEKSKEETKGHSDNKSQSIGNDPLLDNEGKSTFFKRYKSIVKICLNSLNLCNNILMRKSKGAP